MSQQQQQQRVVQLSAASLALVLGRCEPGSSPGPGDTGLRVFEDFRAQNLRSFWNKRLVKAAASVHFQGWMESLVLLVQGAAADLEVLREAWMRRALRSPRGFIIRAVGDLTPVQMSPIPQSQFIPLSEILCSVISDMNAAQVTVNQEALISHMAKAHPGMTIPTQDILYNALGSLIKERKIYHTGEGYFIVTPQTYFITNSLLKDKHRWTENEPPSPPPITYLVSNECCIDVNTEVPATAHCKSCTCFAPRVIPSVQDHQSVSECTGRSLRWPRDSKPSTQHQSTSTAMDYQPSEMSKSATSHKEKEKPVRKFGLSLFRRNVGKKEKPKKEYATFSGQFPPEEWPVRDEDNLNNLPRDLEHAIIKRINPELTVDNLVRHTMLMKKLEERGVYKSISKTFDKMVEKNVDKGVDKGMSTEVPLAAHRHQSKGGKRSSSKVGRSKKRSRSSREKQRGKPSVEPYTACPEAEDAIPSCFQQDIPLEELGQCGYEDSTGGDDKNLFKRRIDNPFQGRLTRDALQGSSHRSQRKKDGKGQRMDSRVGHRSKSWDPSRSKASENDIGRMGAVDNSSCECVDKRGLTFNASLDRNNTKDLLVDYSSSYPDTSTLRIEDKVKLLKEGKTTGKVFGEKSIDGKKMVGQDLIDSRHLVRQTMELDLARPRIAGEYDKALTHPTILRTSIQGRLTGRQPDHVVASHTPEQSNLHQETINSNNQPLRPTLLECNAFTGDDRTLYQQAVDEDACSSLYLNEDSMSESSGASQCGLTRYASSLPVQGEWESTGGEASYHGHQEPELEDYRQHMPSSSHSMSQSSCSPRAGHQFLCESTEGSNKVVESTSTLYSTGQGECVSIAGGGSTAIHWSHGPLAEDRLQEPYKNTESLGSPCAPNTNQQAPGAPSAREVVENHSSTGDSGIDSPRTHMSLPSNSSDILASLRRRSFLQNLEQLQPAGGSLRPQGSLLQLTPVMNV